MAIYRVNPGDWAVGEKLTSAQANGLDTNGAKALDKTTAGDTLSGDVSVASGGSIVLLSGSEITVNAGAEIDVGGALLVANSATTQIDMGTGSSITVSSGSNITTAGTGYLKCNNSDWVKLNSRTKTVSCPMSQLGYFYNTSGVWTRYSNSILGPGAAASSNIFLCEVPHHNGARLSSIVVYFTPAVHGALPAAAPNLSVLNATAAGAVLSATTYTFSLPGVVGSYSATPQVWTINLSPTVTLNNETDTTTIGLYDESGANAVAGNAYYTMKFVYDTITDMRFP